LRRLPTARGHEHETQREDCDADRQVDEEDPVPVELVGEDAAEQHADRSSSGRDETVDPHRLRPLALFCEEAHDEREPDGGNDSAAEALESARGDQEALRIRKAAGERSQREEGDPDQEEAPLAEEIAQPTTEEKKAAE